MKKKTAVEWLIEQLITLDKELDGRRKNEDATVLKVNPTKLYEQAKEMEKEQIMKAFSKGQEKEAMMGFYDRGKEYYKETYGAK